MIFDTDFLIAFTRSHRALSKTQAREFVAALPDSELLLISRVTWMEFVAGYENIAEAKKELSFFTVLEFDGDLWAVASRIIRDLGIRRQRIGTPDCMIAATALAYNQSVVTLNHKHFSRVRGLRVITPS